MRSRLLPPLVAVLASLTLVAACGGSGNDAAGDDGQIASLGTTTTVPPTTGGTDSAAESPDPAGTDGAETFSTDPEEAALDYVECMRDHGVDMPDPQAGGGILMQSSATEDSGEMSVGPGPGDERFVEADGACQKYMSAVTGAMEMDPEQEAEMRQQMLDYAQCMRDHGVDMPDPEFGDNGSVQIRVGSDDDEGPRMDDDDFTAANEACGQEGGGIAIGVGPAPVGGGDG